MGYLLCKGVAISSLVFATSLCIQPVIAALVHSIFLLKVLHQKHMLWQCSPSTAVQHVCLDVVLEAHLFI